MRASDDAEVLAETAQFLTNQARRLSADSTWRLAFSRWIEWLDMAVATEPRPPGLRLVMDRRKKSSS